MVAKIKNMIKDLKQINFKRVWGNIQKRKQDANYYDMLSIEHTITRGIKKVIKKNSRK